MSFLLDPPALFAAGAVIGWHTDSSSRRTRLAGAVVAVFLVVSTLLYLDVLPWWWGAWLEGSDWMLNSGIGTSLEREPGTDVLALVLFASYPLWMRLGLDVSASMGDGDA